MSGPGDKHLKRGKKNQNKDGPDEVEQLSKEEQKIARYLRLSCPKKQGNLHGMKVDFFIAQKLVDGLMESKWGPTGAAAAKKTPTFANRNACIVFMQRLMNKQLFHRALKIYKEQVTDKASAEEKASDTGAEATPNQKKKKK